jgi:hypothetical protein
MGNSTVRDLARSVPPADAQTEKQTGRRTQKRLAERGRKWANKHEILTKLPRQSYSGRAVEIEMPISW